jgi:succinate dehydrogenase / fumarate reductase cytochrome b subunit
VSGKNRETANVGAGLWKGTGMWAWLLHRISGLVLVVYLLAHIGVISQGRLQGQQGFDNLFKTLESPLFILLDVALVAAVIYHGFNGIRIVLMDVGVGIRSHKSVYYAVMGAAIVALGMFAITAISFIL